MQYPREYLIGIQLFNRGDYFEAHEVWEELWRATADRHRDFLQGLIQIAVGLCHFHNGNATGAKRLYARGWGRLEPYRPAALGLDLDRFGVAIAACFEPALQTADGQSIHLESSLVPRIQLEPPPTEWPAVPVELTD